MQDIDHHAGGIFQHLYGIGAALALDADHKLGLAFEAAGVEDICDQFGVHFHAADLRVLKAEFERVCGAGDQHFEGGIAGHLDGVTACLLGGVVGVIAEPPRLAGTRGFEHNAVKAMVAGGAHGGDHEGGLLFRGLFVPLQGSVAER